MSPPAESQRFGIEIRGLRKAYGDTRALDGLSLSAESGEVLGIAGPNGAGKSTLIKILAGEEVADDGQILVGGEPWSPSFAAHRVAVVHQEPALFPNLSVAENLLVGREGTHVLRPRLRREDRALMDELGIGSSARRPLSLCTLAVQQRTEIARALARDARIFLFDEPNSALTQEESGELFRELHRLADAGRIVMLVSHRLSDLVAHTARVAIIRDGRETALLEGVRLTQEAIAHELVVEAEHAERAVDDARAVRPSERESDGSRAILRVSGWTHRDGRFSDIAVTVRSGEIVALVGVEGSGGRELLRSFAGLERTQGTIEVDGAAGDRPVRRRTAYVSATRELSLFTNLAVGQNIIVRLGPEIAYGSVVLRPRQIARLARDAAGRFLVKCRSIAQAIRSLSGGNQQKVAIASAMAKRPRLLVLEEPTRGVDIQSKAEIYRLLGGFAETGNAVVMFCTEVTEVFDAADRVHVVSDGRLSEPLVVADYDRIEALAREISKLERHGQTLAA